MASVSEGMVHASDALRVPKEARVAPDVEAATDAATDAAVEAELRRINRTLIRLESERGAGAENRTACHVREHIFLSICLTFFCEFGVPEAPGRTPGVLPGPF